MYFTMKQVLIKCSSKLLFLPNLFTSDAPPVKTDKSRIIYLKPAHIPKHYCIKPSTSVQQKNSVNLLNFPHTFMNECIVQV